MAAAAGCRHAAPDSAPARWDAAEGVYYLDGMHLRYAPENGTRWMVADAAALPDGFAMCMVDTAAGISVSIIEPQGIARGKRPADCSQADIERIVADITGRQALPATVESRSVERAEYLGAPPWRFATTMALRPDSSTTVCVHYAGYAFDTGDATGIIAVTAPAQASIAAQPYLEYLTR